MRVRVDEAAFTADQAFIKAMIHYEVDIDLFGIEEARRVVFSKVDPQLQAALGYFGEAKDLLAGIEAGDSSSFGGCQRSLLPAGGQIR